MNKKEKKLIKLNKEQPQDDEIADTLINNDKDFKSIQLDENLKILASSIEYRKEQNVKTERKLMEIEKEEEALIQDIATFNDLDEKLSKKNDFFLKCKSLVLDAVQSYKDIVSKIDQMYQVQNGIWRDEFQTSIINNNDTNDNDLSTSSSSANTLPLPSPTKLYNSRKAFLMQAASQIKTLFIKPLDSVNSIKEFFVEWKKKYPFEYTQTYAEMSMVDFCIPLIKIDLLQFDPLSSASNDNAYQIQKCEWFVAFSFNSKALALILSKCLLPRIEYHLDLINESTLHLKPLANDQAAKYILRLKKQLDLIEKYCVTNKGKGKIDANTIEKINLFKNRF